MREETTFVYDKILYPNLLHKQTHPDRLAIMSRFFGIDSKPAEKCRVLELGCGTGSSLLSFSFDLPDSEFVGIDLSEKQIEIGRSAVEATGIKNLSLLQADVMDITREKYGEFDYIVAHGLYSWVPEFVRRQILKVCREMLAPQGVAFISYNTLPGGHLRQMAREMMLFYSKDIDSPPEKVQQSLGFLNFVADSASEGKIHKKILQDEFERLSERSFEGFFHDDLSEVNQPFYFHEFITQAREHDLQFVTEVEYFPTQLGIFPEETIKILQGISEDTIAFEQYLDFIEGRLFRHTLLCHKELNLRKTPDPEFLREVFISSPLKPVSEKPELTTGKRETFSGDNEQRLEIDHPLTKAALFHLGKIWRDSTTFDELVEACRRLLAEESGADFEMSAAQVEELTSTLFQIFTPSFLRFHIHQPVYAKKAGEKPLASPVARWQALQSDSVTTLYLAEFVFREPLGKELLRLLDGTRDRPRLIADLTEFVNSDRYDQPASVKENIIENLPAQLESSLAFFAEKALLVS